jgi:hypothetical protein
MGGDLAEVILVRSLTSTRPAEARIRQTVARVVAPNLGASAW